MSLLRIASLCASEVHEYAQWTVRSIFRLESANLCFPMSHKHVPKCMSMLGINTLWTTEDSAHAQRIVERIIMLGDTIVCTTEVYIIV